jgi:hypothetical protein
MRTTAVAASVAALLVGLMPGAAGHAAASEPKHAATSRPLFVGQRSLPPSEKPAKRKAAKDEAQARPRAKTAKSKAKSKIERILERPVSIEFRQLPLSSAVLFLRDFTNVNILIDRAAGIPEDVPITLSVENVPVKKALKQMLEPAGLTFTVGEEALLITGPEQPAPRVYPVADLVVMKRNGAVVLAAEELVKLVQTTIVPESWDRTGGEGTVRFFAPTMSLVVWQTQTGQDQVESLLESLRRNRGALEPKDDNQAPKGSARNVEQKKAVEPARKCEK